MANSLLDRLAEERAARRADLRRTLTQFRTELRQTVQDDMKHTTAERHTTTAEDRADRKTTAEARRQDVVRLLTDLNRERLENGRRQQEALAAFREELARDTAGRQSEYRQNRTAMSRAQQDELAEFRRDLSAVVSELRRSVQLPTAVSPPNAPPPTPTVTRSADEADTAVPEDTADTAPPRAENAPPPGTTTAPDITHEPHLTDIHGIGPKTEDMLHQIGIETCTELAETDGLELYLALNQAVPKSKTDEWIAAARDLTGQN